MISKLHALVDQELARQESCIDLIASENYTSPTIMQLTGSVLTNKYAEGYPGGRYYAGCSVVDEVERLAINACNKLFNAEHSNVQPHAGSSANFAAYLATIKPQDTILAMSLNAGGHLTHGHAVNFSGKFYKIVHYGVNKETECIDYEELALLAQQHQPKLIVAGTSAYSRLIDYAKIAAIARQNNALFMYDMAHIAGLVAADVIPSPLAYADVVTSTTHKTLCGPRGGLILCKKEFATAIDRAVMPGSQGGPLMHVIAAKAAAFIEAQTPAFKARQIQTLTLAKTMVSAFKNLGYRIVTGGTDNHLFMVDLRTTPPGKRPLTGKQAQETLEACSIILNMNMVPFDHQKPTITSGIRIGTPAIATRGMDVKEAEEIVYLIDEALTHYDEPAALKNIQARVTTLCSRFPIYTTKTSASIQKEQGLYGN